MTAFLALMRREFLEHRGTFLIAPIVMTMLFVLIQLGAFASGRYHMGDLQGENLFAVPVMAYAFFYLTGAMIWCFYLVLASAFYFANAFAADGRNNSMLFWKSMPQSDLKILCAKTAAGMVTFPLIILGFVLFTGLFAYVTLLLARNALPLLALPDFATMAMTFVQTSVLAAGALVLIVLWYVPFYAWIGALASVMGRWAIPVAFLVPALLVVAENLFNPSFSGGRIAHYLLGRVEFAADRDFVMHEMLGRQSVDGIGLLTTLVGQINWIDMTSGWVFAGVVIYLASEYRRRVLGN